MSDGKELSGVQYDPMKRVSLPFTERVHDYSLDAVRVTGQEAVAGVDQNPIDSHAAKVRKFDLAAIQAAFEAISFYYAFRIRNLDLPRELSSVEFVPNSSTGTGADNHLSTDQSFSFTSGSGGFNPRASAEGSASATYEINPYWRALPRSNVPAVAYVFHIKDDSITETQIRTRLEAADLVNTTVNAWPVFKEEEVSFVVNGQQVSVRASADTDTRVVADGSVINGWFAAKGSSSSTSGGVQSSVRQLPACIHNTIVLPSNLTAAASVTVKANTKEITNTVTGTVIAAITNEPTTTSKTATASVTSLNLSATSPATVPSTGMYLYDFNIEDVGFGVSRIVAIVIDASIFA